MKTSSTPKTPLEIDQTFILQETKTPELPPGEINLDYDYYEVSRNPSIYSHENGTITIHARPPLSVSLFDNLHDAIFCLYELTATLPEDWTLVKLDTSYDKEHNTTSTIVSRPDHNFAFRLSTPEDYQILARAAGFYSPRATIQATPAHLITFLRLNQKVVNWADLTWRLRDAHSTT